MVQIFKTHLFMVFFFRAFVKPKTARSGIGCLSLIILSLESSCLIALKEKLIVALATKDETLRGVAKACLLSVAGVGTILQVVAKPRKPR